MWLLPLLIIVVTLIIAIPMSKYIAWIMDGKYRPWPVFRWFENRVAMLLAATYVAAMARAMDALPHDELT